MTLSVTTFTTAVFGNFARPANPTLWLPQERRWRCSFLMKQEKLSTLPAVGTGSRSNKTIANERHPLLLRNVLAGESACVRPLIAIGLMNE